MKQFIFTVIILAFIQVNETGAEPTIQPHVSVAKRFVPSDVDFGRPVYEASFDDPDELNDWKLEGGDVARVTDNGDLLLKSEKHQVFWLAKQIPADFLLEFTMRPHDRKQGLNIVFFNTTGLNGEDIFKSPIKPRDGSFKQYWDGDLKSYHVSYWAGAGANAGTRGGRANLRKNKGKTLIASGNDLITGGETGTFQTVRIYKRGGTIRVMVDDVVAVACDDDEPLDLPGWIGFRQMGHTLSCRYGHVKVWPLRKRDASAGANLFPAPGGTILNENQRRLTHEIKLTKPGHYVFRTRAKSDAIVAQMSVLGALDYDTEGTPFTAPYYGGYTIAFARSDEFTLRELPFVIENGSEPRTITASIEIKRGGGSIELNSVELPQLDGWRLVKMAPDEPGTYVNADPNLRCLWISSDRKLLAVSDSRGEQFRELKPATDSDDPTKDYLNDPFWSIDDKGHWYVSYIMNWLKLHNSFPKTPENSINPGQIWMIPVTPEIGKPLRVIEGLKPGIKRRVLSNGVAVRRAENMGGGHQALSPDRELLLESFQKTSTMSVRSRKTGEVSLNGTGPTRIVVEAEFSDFTKPFEPWFDQRTARNAYAVGILDRDLLFREKLKSGLLATATQQLLVPKSGNYTVWARVKCRRAEERGKFRVTIGETNAGQITVKTTEWKWICSNVEAFPIRAGEATLAFTTTDTGILVDQFLITEDADVPETFPGKQRK